MRVSKEHFGTVYSGFPQDTHFLAVMSEIDAHIARWPGGTLSELRTEVYDIGEATTFDPTFLYSEDPSRTRLSLSDAMEFTGDNDTLNVIVPTHRYAEDIETGLLDLNYLIGSISDDSSFQDKTVRLEIGNEYYAIEGFSAESYGSIANAFVTHIANMDTSAFDFDLEISVQAGRRPEDNTTIISSFGEEALERIDAINVHILPINHKNLYLGSGSEDRFSEMSGNFEDWDNAYSLLGATAPERHVTAWTVGEAASSPSDTDLNFQDYGARGGVTTLALFGEMLEQGISEASAWGVGVSNLNSLGRVDDEGNVVLSHSGAVFAELNNSIVGFEFLESFGDIDWHDSGHLQFGYQAYVAPGHLVLYAVSGESGISTTVNLASKVPDFDSQSARLVNAKTITTEYVDGYLPSGAAEDRLFEVPVINDVSNEESNSNISDGWWGFRNLEEFQISEASFSWRHTGSSTDDVIEGLLLADEFAGAEGNDTIRGFGGDDTLIGGSGGDLIEGGLGDDIIFGDDQSSAWLDVI